jgi:hypothetical protein
VELYTGVPVPQNLEIEPPGPGGFFIGGKTRTRNMAIGTKNT